MERGRGMLALAIAAASLAALAQDAAAHGGLTIPPPRNNHNNRDPRNWTPRGTSKNMAGGPCAGGECLWFSEGCYHGCANCSLTMPTAGNYYGAPSCDSKLAPTLPDAFATWNIPDKQTGKRPSRCGALGAKPISGACTQWGVTSQRHACQHTGRLAKVARVSTRGTLRLHGGTPPSTHALRCHC